MTRGQGMPTSRAYWELRAEQMLNGLFSPQPAIDVEVCDLPGADPSAAAPAAAPAADPPPAPAAAPAAPPAPVPAVPGPLLLTVAALALVAAGSLALLIGQWHQSQRSLREERDLLLLERLRALGPASAPPQDPAALALVPPPPDLGPAPPADQPPPPPPDWIQQLGTLPPPAPAVAPAVPQAAPQAAAASPPARRLLAPLPHLVGVVQIPGRPAAAIFQMGDGSTTVAVGERIGTSGWRLRSADADSAVVEQAGQLRRISLSDGG
jgi:hypothetical protein